MKIHKANEGRASSILNEWKQKNKWLLPLNFNSWVIHISEHKNDEFTEAKEDLPRQIVLPFYKPISRVVQISQNAE